MAEKPWIYLSNPFLVATRTSFEKALGLSSYTDNALEADPAQADLYTFYHPRHLALVAAYGNWKSAGGMQKTSTATLKSLIDGLTVAVNDWDYDIQAIARKGTPQYLTFFPRGHEPFISGKQETRIAAVDALNRSLDTVTPVPAVKTKVSDYLADLNTAAGTQEGKFSQTDALSDALEAARVNACQGLYYVMSGLMQTFYHNPLQVERYFDMELLRRRPQEDFTGSVAAGALHTIVKRTLAADDLLLLKNTGLVPLTFYLGSAKDAPQEGGSPAVSVEPGQQTHVPASALGNVATNKYLIVQNPSGLTEGNWEVEV